MDTLSWLRLCCLLKLIVELNGYMLFAANVDDFRNIARKLVPVPLADKLTKLAADAPKPKSRDIYESYDYESEKEFEDTDDDEEEKSATDKNMYDVKEWNTRVSFDELVERVKDRLATELQEKLQYSNPQKNVKAHSVYGNDYPARQNTKDRKDTHNKKTSGYNYNTGQRDAPEKTSYFESHRKPNTRETTQKTLYYEKNTEQTPFQEIYKDRVLPERNKLKRIPYRQVGLGASKPYNSKLIDRVITTRDKRSREEELYTMNTTPKRPAVFNDEYINKHATVATHDRNAQVHKDDTDSANIYLEEKLSEDKKYAEYENVKYEDEGNIDRDLLQKKSDVETLKAVGSNKNPVDEKPIYSQFDLAIKGNDSYEEYVIPTKEANVFESEDENPTSDKPKDLAPDNRHFKQTLKNKAKENVQVLKDEWNILQTQREKSISVDTDNHENKKSEEIKAKTESLWFDYDDKSKDTEIISESPQIKKKGTMLPRKEVYKMVSPNYYISLPTIAEKYDSNEPIPEKDRVREAIKHFIIPSASINKKVRLL